MEPGRGTARPLRTVVRRSGSATTCQFGALLELGIDAEQRRRARVWCCTRHHFCDLRGTPWFSFYLRVESFLAYCPNASPDRYEPSTRRCQPSANHGTVVFRIGISRMTASTSFTSSMTERGAASMNAAPRICQSMLFTCSTITMRGSRSRSTVRATQTAVRSW